MLDAAAAMSRTRCERLRAATGRKRPARPRVAWMFVCWQLSCLVAMSDPHPEGRSHNPQRQQVTAVERNHDHQPEPATGQLSSRSASTTRRTSGSVEAYTAAHAPASVKSLLAARSARTRASTAARAVFGLSTDSGLPKRGFSDARPISPAGPKLAFQRPAQQLRQLGDVMAIRRASSRVRRPTRTGGRTDGACR